MSGVGEEKETNSCIWDWPTGLETFCHLSSEPVNSPVVVQSYFNMIIHLRRPEPMRGMCKGSARRLGKKKNNLACLGLVKEP